MAMMQQQPISEPRRIGVSELKALLDVGAPVEILDVRADDAYAGSNRQIPGSIRISPHDSASASNLPHDRLVVTYCT